MTIDQSSPESQASNQQRKQNPARVRQNPAKILAMAFIGVGLLVLGGLALVMLTRSSSASPQDEINAYPSAVPANVNFKAPDLTLVDTSGKESNLADFSGKVVLVNNWAFWCPPCRAELPELQEYYNAHRKQDFTIVGIEAGGDEEDVLYHVDLYKLKYPIWLDPGSLALRLFQNQILPNSYVIDRQGVVRLAWNGPIDRNNLERFVTPLLEEQ